MYGVSGASQTDATEDLAKWQQNMIATHRRIRALAPFCRIDSCAYHITEWHSVTTPDSILVCVKVFDNDEVDGYTVPVRI